MANTVTAFEQRKQKNDIRNERKDRGTCIDCGEREAGRNLNGEKSIRCDDCKEAFLAKRGPIKPASKTSITVPPRYAPKLSSDEIDERHEIRCIRAARQVLPFIKKLKRVSVGELSRQFIEHRTYLETVLEILTISGDINYAKNAPAPRWVTIRTETRQPIQRRKYGQGAVSPRADRTLPDAAALYGEANLRIL